MKKSVARTVSLGLGMILLMNGCKGLEPLAIAQGLNCQEERNQPTQNRLLELRDRAQDNIQLRKLERATQDLTELFQLMQSVSNSRDKVLSFTEIVNGTQAQEGILEELIDRLVESGMGDLGTPVLEAAVGVSNTFDSGYSYGKTRTLAGIARLYAESGQRDRALATLARASLAETGIRGAAFKTKGLSEIARAYVALGDTIQASQILGRSLHHAESITYQDAYSQAWDFQPLAIYYGKIGQVDKALEIANKISQAYYRSDTFAVIARDLAEQGNIERAHQIVLDRVSETEIKARILAEIGLQSAKQGQTNRVVPLFTEAVRNVNFILDQNSRMIALTPILMHYAEAGYPDLALKELTPVVSPEINAKVLSAIAVEYATQGQRDQATAIAQKALETLGTIPDQQEQQFLLMDMVRDYTRVGLYDEAIQAARKIPYPEQQQTLLLELATAAATRGNDEIAVKAAEIFPINLVTVAFTYQKLGQTERGAELLDRGIKLVDSLESDELKFEALAGIAAEYAKAGQPAKAEELFTQALLMSNQVQENSYAWVTVFDRLLEARLYDFGLKLIRGMKDEYFQSTLINRLAEKFIESGEMNSAYQLLDLLKSPAERVSHLIKIADQTMKMGKRDFAREALDQSFDIAQTIPGEESNLLILKGQTDAEGNLIQYTEVDDWMDRGSLYEEIAIGYGRLGEFDLAMQVVRSLESPTLRNQVQQRLACYR